MGIAPGEEGLGWGTSPDIRGTRPLRILEDSRTFRRLRRFFGPAKSPLRTPDAQNKPQHRLSRSLRDGQTTALLILAWSSRKTSYSSGQRGSGPSGREPPTYPSTCPPCLNTPKARTSAS
ncbi:hypothetical protein FA13DRAFT_370241 [Coprinellus micaceus]|uniref:Uncharacterized protein n=1 Tax=Coprinellus micaceus TaxID=71717 RepID=A0A4Y7TC19_COPMI|nr:hypothetical protein FA13DRAFT_370241 [Coprinellus micaceus]